MKILIDMNLSPDWCEVFSKNEIESIHWSNIGNPAAADSVIMDWAKNNDYVVFTHDLDFGTILAATSMTAASVIQVRTQDNLPDERLSNIIIDAIGQLESHLNSGALITIDENKLRVRILPIAQN
jgi:predicted nuclease of predicted toxin-antitoxin system